MDIPKPVLQGNIISIVITHRLRIAAPPHPSGAAAERRNRWRICYLDLQATYPDTEQYHRCHHYVAPPHGINPMPLYVCVCSFLLW